MKIHIPTIRDQYILTSDWSCKILNSWTNNTFIQKYYAVDFSQVNSNTFFQTLAADNKANSYTDRWGNEEYYIYQTFETGTIFSVSSIKIACVKYNPDLVCLKIIKNPHYRNIEKTTIEVLAEDVNNMLVDLHKAGPEKDLKLP